MAALFKRSPRPGPIAPFKTWPKTWTYGRVLDLDLWSRLKHGYSFHLRPRFKWGYKTWSWAAFEKCGHRTLVDNNR